MFPPPIPMTVVNLNPFIQIISPDKKYAYIGGGLDKMSSIIKWSLFENEHDWQFLVKLQPPSG